MLLVLRMYPGRQRKAQINEPVRAGALTHSRDHIRWRGCTKLPVYRIPPGWLRAAGASLQFVFRLFIPSYLFPILHKTFLLFPICSQHLQLTLRSGWLRGSVQWHLPNHISCNTKALWDTDGCIWEKYSLVKWSLEDGTYCGHPLKIHTWYWCSNNLATWYKKLTHWKRLWCLERLKAKGDGGGRDEMVR